MGKALPMSADVTQSDVDSADARIAELAALAAEVRGQIRLRRAQSTRMSFAASFYAVVSIVRGSADKFNVWRGGVVSLLPLFVGSFAFIASDILTSHRVFSIISGTACCLFTAITGYCVLLHTPAEEAARRRDEACRKLDVNGRQLKELKHRQQSLASETKAAESHCTELAEQLEHLNKIRSAEYQRDRMFERNWRAMRSVEFEDYLEEVLRLLGYDIETTAITGDQGVDLIAAKRGIRIAIQVKGYVNSVSNSAIQEAFAGMAHYNCHHCAVITNSRFTSGAVQLAQSTGCILIHEDNFYDFVMGHLDLLRAANQTVT